MLFPLSALTSNCVVIVPGDILEARTPLSDFAEMYIPHLILLHKEVVSVVS